MSGIGPRLKTAASQHFVRSLGCCGRDLLAVSLSAFDHCSSRGPLLFVRDLSTPLCLSISYAIYSRATSGCGTEGL